MSLMEINLSSGLIAEGLFNVKTLKKFLKLKEQQALLRENALKGTNWASCPVLAQLVRGVTDACASHQWQDALLLLPCITVRCYPLLPVEYCAQVAAALMGAGLLDGKEMPAIVQAMAPSSMLPLLSRIVQHTSWEDPASQSLLTGTRPTASQHDEERIRAVEETVRGSKKKLDGALRNSYRGLLCYLRWRCARDHLLLQEACEAAQTAPCQQDASPCSSHPLVGGRSQSQVSSDAAVRSSEATIGSDQDDEKLPNAITGPSAADLSQQLDRVDDVLRQLTSDDGDVMRLAEQATMLLEPCVHDSVVPCEWLLTPLLEAVHASRGLDAALDVARQYLRRHRQHAPAHRAVLHFVRAHDTQHQVASLQLQLLKNLQRLSPGDDSVLVLVETLLDSPSSCTLEDKDVAVQSDEEDDDGHLDEDTSTEADTAASLHHCCLRDETKARSCVSAVRMLVLLLHCPHWKDVLRPWELLHRALAVLHSAWLQCWRCRGCQWSRRSALASVTPWWRLWWARHNAPQQPSTAGNSGPPEDGAALPTIPLAKLAMHRAVVAHVLCIDLKVKEWRAALLNDGWSALANELRDTVNREGPHASKFARFRNRNVVRPRLGRVDTKRSPVRGEKVLPEESERCRLLDRRLGGDSQVAEWAAPVSPPPIPRCPPAPSARPDSTTPLVCRFMPLRSEGDSDLETSRRQPKKPKFDLRRRHLHHHGVKEKTKPRKSRCDDEPIKPKMSSKGVSAMSPGKSAPDDCPASVPSANEYDEKVVWTPVLGNGSNTRAPSPAGPVAAQDPPSDRFDSIHGNGNYSMAACCAEVGPKAVSTPVIADYCRGVDGPTVSRPSPQATVEWPISTQCSGPSQDVVPCGQPVVERQCHLPGGTNSGNPDTDLDLPLLTESFHFISPHVSLQHDTDVDDASLQTACEQLFDACSVKSDGETSQQCPPAVDYCVQQLPAHVTVDTHQALACTETDDSSVPLVDRAQLAHSVPDVSESSQQTMAQDTTTKRAPSQNSNHSLSSPSPDIIPSSSIQVDNRMRSSKNVNGDKETFSFKSFKLPLRRDLKKSSIDTAGDGCIDRNQSSLGKELESRQLLATAVSCSGNVVPGARSSDDGGSDDSDVVPQSPQDESNFEARHYERCTRLDRDAGLGREGSRVMMEEECAAHTTDNARQTEHLLMYPGEQLPVSETVTHKSGFGQPHPVLQWNSPLQDSETVLSSPLKKTLVVEKSPRVSNIRKTFPSSPKTQVVESYSCKNVTSETGDEVAPPEQPFALTMLVHESLRRVVLSADGELLCNGVIGESEGEGPGFSPVKKKMKYKKSKSEKRLERDGMLISPTVKPHNWLHFGPEQTRDPEGPSLSSLGNTAWEGLAAAHLERKTDNAACSQKNKSYHRNEENEQSSFVKTPKRHRNEVHETKKKNKFALDSVTSNTEEQVMTGKNIHRLYPSPAEYCSQKKLKRMHLQHMDSPVMRESKKHYINCPSNQSTPPNETSITAYHLQTPKQKRTKSSLEQNSKENIPSSKKALKHRENIYLGEDFLLNRDQENDLEEPAIVYEQTVSRMNGSSSSNNTRRNQFKVNKKRKMTFQQSPESVSSLESGAKVKCNDHLPSCNDRNPTVAAKRGAKVKSKVKCNDDLPDHLPPCNDRIPTIDVKRGAKVKSKVKCNDNLPNHLPSVDGRSPTIDVKRGAKVKRKVKCNEDLPDHLPSFDDSSPIIDAKLVAKSKAKKRPVKSPNMDWINIADIGDVVANYYKK